MDDTAAGLPFREAFSIERSLRHGWRSLLRCFPILFVGGCLKACTDGGGGSGGNWDGGDSGSSDAMQRWIDGWGQPGSWAMDLDPAALLGSAGLPDVGEWVLIGVMLAVVTVVIVALLAFRAWLIPGYLRLHREILQTGEGRWETLFSGADRFVAMFVWQLLGVVVGLGTLALAGALPAGVMTWGITQHEPLVVGAGVALLGLVTLPIVAYVSLGLLFGDAAVALDELGAVDALARSWSLASGNRIWLLIFALVTWIVQVLVTIPGLCFCCVGIWVTRATGFAIRDVGFTSAYLLHTLPEDETRGWSIWSWESA